MAKSRSPQSTAKRVQAKRVQSRRVPPKGAPAKPPRTASGKRVNPGLLEMASAEALAGTKERTEEGHIKAGRTPPSQTTASRQSGATRVIDDSIRDYSPTVTED